MTIDLAWINFAGLCVSCASAIFAWLAKQQASEGKEQSKAIHVIVNSRFDAQAAEIKALTARITELTTTPKK